MIARISALLGAVLFAAPLGFLLGICLAWGMSLTSSARILQVPEAPSKTALGMSLLSFYDADLNDSDAEFRKAARRTLAKDANTYLGGNCGLCSTVS